MTKQTEEALKMAIEAMKTTDEAIIEFFEGLVKLGVPERLLKMDKCTKLVPAINACKEALAQPAQEAYIATNELTGEMKTVYLPAQEPVAHIKQGMDGYPKLVFNGKFEYESIAAKWNDIALYTKEQL